MAALAAIWGSSFLFIKVGVTELHPLFVALGRVLGGAVALIVVVLLVRDRLPRDPRFWAHNAVVAVLGVALPFTLFGFGEQRISSVLAGIWNSVTPLIALPMAVLVFRTEKMTRRRVLGLVLGFLGAATILGVWQGVGGSSLAGQLMCLTAAACYGVAIPYTRRYISPRSESGLAASAGQLLVATALLARRGAR
jgi:drug/metabolite transporter (DMT)-like permease